MELNDILLLIKAGYTKEEIENAQLLAQKPADPNTAPVPAPVATTEPETKPAEQKAQVAEPVAVPTPIPTPAQAQDQPTMADLMQSIAKLTSAIQSNAIAQSVIPQGLQNPPRAEDMIAEIIRPTYHQRSD